MVYDLPGVQIDTELELFSFQDFFCRGQSDRPVIGLHGTATLPLAKEPLFTAHHKEMCIAVLQDGWQFSLPHAPALALQLTADRRTIYTVPMEDPATQMAMLPLLRTAIECAGAMEGVISLHSACLEIDDHAICFTAPSGVGKSTRAMQWEKTLGAKLISGDRPSLQICPDGVMACGVPWDGKEQIYRNIRRPLKKICVIERGDTVAVRPLSRTEARQIMMQQTFLPMWDTEAAAAVLVGIRKILDSVPVVQLQCGPDENAAKQAYELLYNRKERNE